MRAPFYNPSGARTRSLRPLGSTDSGRKQPTSTVPKAYDEYENMVRYGVNQSSIALAFSAQYHPQAQPPFVRDITPSHSVICTDSEPVCRKAYADGSLASLNDSNLFVWYFVATDRKVSLGLAALVCSRWRYSTSMHRGVRGHDMASKRPPSWPMAPY